MAKGYGSIFSGDVTVYFESNRRSAASETKGRRHYHNLFELYYMCEGRCNYFIDDETFEIRSGDLVLIPEGVIHNTIYSEGGHERKLLNVSHGLIPKSAERVLDRICYLYRNDNIAEELRRIFGEIEREYLLGDEFSEDMLRARLTMLFTLLARNENQAGGRCEGGSRAVRRAVKYIQENYSLPITLSSVAEECSVSAEHLCREFKKETGFGFSEYLRTIRLQRAEELLSENPMIKVSEVAEDCGFSDSNYFSCVFAKAHGGISPIKYRNESAAKSQLTHRH